VEREVCGEGGVWNRMCVDVEREVWRVWRGRVRRAWRGCVEREVCGWRCVDREVCGCVICVPIKCLLMCFYCIVTTEDDHRSVVETFGEKDKFFVEPPG